jgi:bifunctional ADP-heptose synthase (sugar kinase/adenylyltransferase)
MSLKPHASNVYHGGSAAITQLIQSFCFVRWNHDDQRTKKTRYLVNGEHVFETVTAEPVTAELAELSAYHGDYDMFMLADFGHGMFEGKALEPLTYLRKFVALNVQTNSSNYGFNLFTKHKRFDYLVIDTREARLGVQDRWSDPLTVAHKVHAAIGGRAMALTAGPNGAYLFNGANTHYCPAFSGPVVDAIGAGDVYFAVTSLLMRVQADPEIVNFVGNVAAGLKTGILGHGSTVTKEQLLRACRSILA